MEEFFNQIEMGVNSNLFFLSLFTALAVPDICGALVSTDGEASKKNYVDWFDSNVAPLYSGNLSGEDCYFYRCAALHQASSQHRKSTYSRIIFVEPSIKSLSFHNLILDDALNIDLKHFCQDIVKAARDFCKTNSTDATFQNNYSKVMQRYPKGIPPYISGVPVIS